MFLDVEGNEKTPWETPLPPHLPSRNVHIETKAACIDKRPYLIIDGQPKTYSKGFLCQNIDKKEIVPLGDRFNMQVWFFFFFGLSLKKNQ